MNSNQMYSALKLILTPYKISTFGVVSSDELEHELYKSTIYPKIFICNVLPSTSKVVMGHWILVYATSEYKIEVFDSFGKGLLFYSKKYFNCVLKKQPIQNKRSVQNWYSEVCGMYCLYYIFHRLRRVSMSQLMKIFGRNTLKNDKIVINFYANLKLKLCSKYKCSQTSCSQKKFLCRNVIYCK